MELLSTNIALRTDILYRGKTVSTGIFKKPVGGKISVKKTNLDGDEQVDLVNHGGEHKAVYAFSSDHYCYWRDVLKKPELQYGAFGENLTISGFDESCIHIGDQFRIGSCILEVTQPRVPCFKLGVALENVEIPRLFVESFSTGVYLRVLLEGSIETGDQVVLLKEGEFQVSVKSVFQAYFDKTYQNASSVIEKALRITELSPEWSAKLSKKIRKKS